MTCAVMIHAQKRTDEVLAEGSFQHNLIPHPDWDVSFGNKIVTLGSGVGPQRQADAATVRTKDGAFQHRCISLPRLNEPRH